MKIMLIVKDVSKRFGNFTALSHISFSLSQGEVVGLLGANGSGKTTLLRILSTMLSPSEGEAYINGYRLGQDNASIRKNVGVLFGSDAGLYDELTGEENLQYFAALSSVPKKNAEQRIQNLANKLEFEKYLGMRAGAMSKGMRQKIVFARSVIHDPALLLLDEPESGLDFQAAQTVYDFIMHCKKDGKGVLFSSHSMDSVGHCAQRVLMLKNGQLMADEVLDNNVLVKQNQLSQLIDDYIKGGTN